MRSCRRLMPTHGSDGSTQIRALALDLQIQVAQIHAAALDLRVQIQQVLSQMKGKDLQIHRSNRSRRRKTQGVLNGVLTKNTHN